MWHQTVHQYIYKGSLWCKREILKKYYLSDNLLTACKHGLKKNYNYTSYRNCLFIIYLNMHIWYIVTVIHDTNYNHSIVTFFLKTYSMSIKHSRRFLLKRSYIGIELKPIETGFRKWNKDHKKFVCRIYCTSSYCISVQSYLQLMKLELTLRLDRLECIVYLRLYLLQIW